LETKLCQNYAQLFTAKNVTIVRVRKVDVIMTICKKSINGNKWKQMETNGNKIMLENNIFSFLIFKDLDIFSLSRYFDLFYFLRKFWLGKFFSVSKLDKKNVQISFLKNNLPKNLICDHILFLWSRGAKKFFNFVMIFFFIFLRNLNYHFFLLLI